MMPALPLPQLDSAELVYLRAACAGLAPDPKLTVSEWADTYRILSTKASSEPHLWRTARTPYLRDIMDALSPTSPWQRIVFLKAAQIGGTECGLNWLGYIMHRNPGSILAVQPTVEMAKRLSKQRLDPMITACPELHKRVRDRKDKDSGSTLLQKEFPGGTLVLTGANSATGLRSMPVRFLFLDEVDAYPFDLDGEGDPVNLAIARTRTFPQRKIFMASTPSRTGSSRIERLDEEGDKRLYEVPCPHCGHMQPLEFQGLKWAKGMPRKAQYYCRSCAKVIPETAKTKMLAGGRWRATAEGDGVTAGFRLSSLYSPLGWYTWGEAAEAYERAGNPQDIQVFYNTVLGMSYAESGETPDDHRLYERREPYQLGVVPRGAGVLTCGVDVQRDRIELEIVAWGAQRESWSVDYRVHYGDPSQQQVWEKVTALLDEEFPCESGGTLQLARIAVDSGYLSLHVYDWSRRVNSSRVMIVHGDASGKVPALLGRTNTVEIGPQGQKLRYGVRVWPINVSIAKEELYRNLRLPVPQLEKQEKYPPGFCHFPQYSLEYFEQLCAEEVRTRMVNGYPRPYWAQRRERNEALDCRVYARAAAAAERIDLWTEERWAQVLDDLTNKPVDQLPAYHGISRRGMSPMPKQTSFGADDPYLD